MTGPVGKSPSPAPAPAAPNHSSNATGTFQAGSALAGTSAEATAAASTIASAQASALITMAAQNEMTRISNAIALNEALCNTQKKLGDSVKGLSH